MNNTTRPFLLPLFFFAILMLFTEGLMASTVAGGKIMTDLDDTARIEVIKHETGEIPHEEPGPVDAHAEGGHKSNMFPLLFIIIALIIGAGTRHWLRKSPLPFTVSLLIIGLGLGAANRLGWFEVWHIGSLSLNIDWLGQSLNWAGKIDPHLILYVFLPTLIFEAAFAMDVHTFKKSVTNATLLAVPGIIIALILTAAIVIGLKGAGLGFAGWGWPMALLFGAVVSATDPVAVVALLKDLGASKKLGTLIEGESLLNDGTAIVIFMVLLASITGTASDTSPIVVFFRVAVGGVFVGIFFGWLTIRWVKKVFNDALIEITVIVAAAYLTFFVAEYFLHVSGVLGLVSLGLMMAGVGRTRISPEVEHFLHEFWELAAFFANTLIFVIVGVVIANNSKFTGHDFLLLFIIYIGVHVVRAIVIVALYPLMRRAGYGLPKKDAIVVWYGALRGAIGLALALIVAAEASIDQEIRDTFLFLTAGMVTLFSLINATTIKYVVNGLGLTKVAPAKALMMITAKSYLRQSTENSINKFKKDRFLNRADWEIVNTFLPEKVDTKNKEELHLDSQMEETRRRILEREKSSYWNQFREGMLGPTAVRRLTDAINEIMDEGGLVSLSKRKDLEQEWKTPKILGKLQSMPILGKVSQRFFFERLSTSYDSARGFVQAQDESLKLIENMLIAQDDEGEGIDHNNLTIIEAEINENKIHGLTFLRNLRNSYPEIYNAIATRQAIRSVLNYEKRMVERLLNKGRVDSGEAGKIISGIEERMKRLMDRPPALELPKPVELLRDISWLAGLEETTFNRVVKEFQNRVYAVDATLVKEKGPGDGLFVVVRGQVKISVQDKVVDILGPGSVIGEMAVLTGLQRTATVSAESPVTVLWMSTSKMKSIMKNSKDLENRLWKFASMRFAMNLLSHKKPYDQWQQNEFRLWLAAGDIMYPDESGHIDLKGKVGILVTGKATTMDKEQILTAPNILENSDYTYSSNSRVFIREQR
ncbi:MAG TPA: cyclic nucleotide-binding domain-containing protein [Bacteroides sp.]|nr:cyclic nucleotide-binding domain-containing protein [Bacteroides sp.]